MNITVSCQILYTPWRDMNEFLIILPLNKTVQKFITKTYQTNKYLSICYSCANHVSHSSFSDL